jgi:hypothetical protein
MPKGGFRMKPSARRAATFIGDVGISVYVLDLFWLMQERSQAPTKFA